MIEPKTRSDRIAARHSTTSVPGLLIRRSPVQVRVDPPPCSVRSRLWASGGQAGCSARRHPGPASLSAHWIWVRLAQAGPAQAEPRRAAWQADRARAAHQRVAWRAAPARAEPRRAAWQVAPAQAGPARAERQRVAWQAAPARADPVQAEHLLAAWQVVPAQAGPARAEHRRAAWQAGPGRASQPGKSASARHRWHLRTDARSSWLGRRTSW